MLQSPAMDDPIYHCPQCGSLVDKGNSLCHVCGALYRIAGVAAEQVGQTCFECGHQADGKPASCPECGADYQIECPACSKTYPLGTSLCPSCQFDPSSEYRDVMDARQGRGHRLRKEGAGANLFRIFMLLAIVGGLFLLVDKVDWGGPQAIGGLIVVLLLLSLVVVYVIYAPALGKTVRKKKRRRQSDGIFTMVYRTLDLARAEHLTALLESEEIPAFVYNRHATTLDPFDIFSGIRVMVPRDRLSEIRQIMESFGFDTDDIEDESLQDG